MKQFRFTIYHVKGRDPNGAWISNKNDPFNK